MVIEAGVSLSIAHVQYANWVWLAMTAHDASASDGVSNDAGGNAT